MESKCVTDFHWQFFELSYTFEDSIIKCQGKCSEKDSF
jgi:hypothetical protein